MFFPLQRRGDTATSRICGSLIGFPYVKFFRNYNICMKLRVATYNIHKGVSPLGGQLRIHALKQAIGMLEADVLFLQEVQGRHDLHAARYSASWPQQTQYDFLA